MKVEIVDMNLQENHDLWDKEWNGNDNACYTYSFPDAYIQHHNSDAYIFLWDDGKGKHMSYEAHLRMPFKFETNAHRVEETFYGADKAEAMCNMNEWLKEHVEFIKELSEELCEASSELPAE